MAGERNTVEGTIRVTAKAEGVEKAEKQTRSLAGAMRDLPEAGNRAKTGLGALASGAGLGRTALAALETTARRTADALNASLQKMASVGSSAVESGARGMSKVLGGVLTVVSALGPHATLLAVQFGAMAAGASRFVSPGGAVSAVLAGIAERAGRLHTVLGGAGIFTSLATGAARFIPAAAAAAVGLAGITFGMRNAVLTAGEFNKTMANVSAITGATGDTLDYLRSKAIEFSRDSVASAQDVAEAFKLVASSKPELLENAEALAAVTKQVVTLSQASGLGLGESAKALTNALSQFGAGADQAERFVNVLAAASKFGKAEIPELNEALVKAGTVGAQAGLSFEQTAAALEKLSEFGAPAEEFATGFRNVLLQLLAGANDTNPKIQGLTNALINLGSKGYTIADLAQKFGDRQAVVAQQMILTAQAADDLTAKVTGTGAAQELAKANTDNLIDQLGRLRESVKNLTIEMFGEEKNLTDFVKLLADAVNKAAELRKTAAEATSYLPSGRTVAGALGGAATGATLLGPAGIVPGAIAGGAAAKLGNEAAAAAREVATLRKEQESWGSAAVASTARMSALIRGITALGDSSRNSYEQASGLTSAMFNQNDITQRLAQATRNYNAGLAENAERLRIAKLEEERLAEARAQARISGGDAVAVKRIENAAREEAVQLKLDSQRANALVAARREAFLTKDRQRGLALAIEAGREAELTAKIQANTKAHKENVTAQQRAIETAEDHLGQMQAEVGARTAAIAAGKSLVDIEADVAAAKVLAKTHSQDLADKTREEARALGELEAQNTKLKASYGERDKLLEQVEAVQLQAAALDRAAAAGLRGRDAQNAMAAAAAKAKDSTEGQRLGLDELTQSLLEQSQALEKRNNLLELEQSIADDTRKAQAKLEILEATKAGVLDLRDAEVALSTVDVFANLPDDIPPETRAAYGELLALNRRVEEDQERLKNSTIDLGESLAGAIDGIVDGILQGTNSGLDAMEVFSRTGQKLLGDMFKGILRDKLSFDGQFQANFLRDIPGWVQQGAQLMSQAFGSGLDTMTVQSANASNPQSPGSLANNVTSVIGIGQQAYGLIGGLFGGGAGGGAAGGAALGNIFAGAGSLVTGGVPLFAGTGALSGATLSTAAIGAGPVTGALGSGVVAPGVVLDAATGTVITTGVGAPSQAGIAGASGAAAGAGGALAAAGIAAAAAAAVIGIIGTLQVSHALGKMRDTFYSYDDSHRAASKMIHDDAILGGLAELTTRLMSFGAIGGKQAGKNMFDLFSGDVSFGNIAGTTALILANPLAPLTYLASQPPTGGTALRKGFEEFIENDAGFSGFFGRDSGTFKRGIGQTGLSANDVHGAQITRAGRAAIGQGTRGIMAQTGLEFVPAMRQFIDLQQKAIGLSDKQLDQAYGLATAYRAIVGKQAGEEEQRSLAIIADLLGSITAEGADAAEATKIFGDAVKALDRPAKLFDKLFEFAGSKDNDIALQDLERGVRGLADALLSDLPQGVDAGMVALELFRKQGAFTFEQLNEQIEGAVAEASAFGPALAEAFNAGLFDKNLPVDEFADSLFEAVDNAFRKSIAELTFDNLIQGAFKGNILGPLLAKIDETERQVQSGDLTRAAASEIEKQALRDAKEAMQGLKPLMNDLIEAGRDLASVFSEADDSAAGLAQALVVLEEAQRTFNDALETRIYALRNQGDVSPEILRRQLPDIEREFRLMQLKFFGSISEVVAAANSGLIRPSEMPGYLNTARGGPNEPTADQKLAALTQMQALAERDLQVRIDAINAELAAEVRRHETAIKGLQDEREQIQKQYADAIEARQTELEAIQEQLQVAQQWKAVVDETKDTIFQLRTGSGSSELPGARFAIAEAEFRRQQAILNDTAATDDQRTAAAAKLNQLGPQLLQLLAAAGIAQSSEQYRVVFDEVTAALTKAQKLAEEKAGDVEALQKRQTELTQEIKDLQKEQARQLEAIDASIEREQDAIVAAQDAAKAKIEQASKNTADVLDWIRGQGNAIFQQKQDELKAKLDALGVDNVSLEGIQTASLSELQRIRQVLEDHGFTVDGGGTSGGTGGGTGGGDTRPSSGRYGLTQSGQDALAGELQGKTTQGDTYARLRAILGLSAEQYNAVKAGEGPLAKLITTIQDLFPGARSFDAVRSIVGEMKHKIEDPSYVSPILGFKSGALVRGETTARVGEGNRPELILPLDRALREVSVRRALGIDRMDRVEREMRKLREVERQSRRPGIGATPVLQKLRDLVRPTPRVRAESADALRAIDALRREVTGTARGDDEIKVALDSLKVQVVVNVNGPVDGDIGDSVRRALTPDVMAELMEKAMKRPGVQKAMAEAARRRNVGQARGV